jgi:hypothetical protein
MTAGLRAMTEAELYEFDIRGYVRIPGALGPQEVAELNAAIDGHFGARVPLVFDPLDVDPSFQALMARPETIALLRSVIGDWLRYDHGFGLHIERDRPINENLHGGPRTGQGANHYQWVHGTTYNGMIVAAYVLADVRAGDGGLVFVPGSHRANGAYRPALDSHLVTNPGFDAGDLVVFSEAVVHGTRAWHGAWPRRNVVFKYAPGYMAVAPADDVLPYLERATTDLERELLRPPGVTMRPRLSLPRL